MVFHKGVSTSYLDQCSLVWTAISLAEVKTIGLYFAGHCSSKMSELCMMILIQW